VVLSPVVDSTARKEMTWSRCTRSRSPRTGDRRAAGTRGGSPGRVVGRCGRAACVVAVPVSRERERVRGARAGWPVDADGPRTTTCAWCKSAGAGKVVALSPWTTAHPNPVNQVAVAHRAHRPRRQGSFLIVVKMWVSNGGFEPRQMPGQRASAILVTARLLQPQRVATAYR